MLKINPEDQFIVSKLALHNILKNYDIHSFEYELPKSGVSNTNIIIELLGVKKYVLRILRKNKKTHDEISLEIDFQNFLANNLLPVAKIIPNIKSEFITLFQEDRTVWQCILIEFIEGSSPKIDDFNGNYDFLQSIAYQNAHLYNTSIKYTGKYEKKPISNLSQTSTAKIIENLVKDIDFTKLKNENLLNIVSSRNELYLSIEKLDLAHSLIHDDINIGNILLYNNKITGILDFDELYYGPVISCAVNAAFEFVRFGNNPANVFEYLSYFQKEFTLSKDDISIVKNLLLLRNMMFIVYLVRFHGEDFPHIATHLNLIDKINSLQKR